jgi:hypothetical protein
LAEVLERSGLLDHAGGNAYIAELTNVFSVSNTEFYEKTILTDYHKRLILRAVSLAKESLERGEGSDKVTVELVEAMDAASGSVDATEPDRGILFADLLKKEFPAETFFIDRLIGAGLTVMTGASKIGKSWTALQMTAALDQGGYFLGSLQCQKVDVLYMALEDTQGRIKKRLAKQGISVFNGSRLETKRRTVADLRALLKNNPQYRVVIIDTLQKLLGIQDLNDYSQTVSGLSALKAIADDLNIAVVVIHHNRKGGDLDGDHMESALGSTGINATADCTLTMRRKRGATDATLNVTGRDLEDTVFSLSWDKDICCWSATSQGDLKPTISEAQREIIDLLKSESRNWTTAEIAASVNKGKSATSNLLKKLCEAGQVESPYYGQYKAKTSFTVSPLPRESESVKPPSVSGAWADPIFIPPF